MAVTYKKLWKLLIDRDMKKKELCEMAHVSSESLAMALAIYMLGFSTYAGFSPTS